MRCCRPRSRSVFRSYTHSDRACPCSRPFIRCRNRLPIDSSVRLPCHAAQEACESDSVSPGADRRFADVSPDATIATARPSGICAGARAGAPRENCIVGRGAYIGTGVVMGDNCKVQNYALVYEPHDWATASSSARQSCSRTKPIRVRSRRRDHQERTRLGACRRDDRARGGIGARATCVAPVTIGAWATVAAGAVVVKDVPASRSWQASPPDASDGWGSPACRWSPAPTTRPGCAPPRVPTTSKPTEH